MVPTEVLPTPLRQPVPAEPLPWLDDSAAPTPDELDRDPRVTYIGRVRVPIAGPYRPWARLYRLPDLRLVWVVRLWESTRAVHRLTSTRALLTYARLSGLSQLAERIQSLERQGRGDA
jgi:hypothetical protein